MRMIRVYIDAALSPGTRITLPDVAANHLVRVLRLQPGADCVLFNGDGCDYSARLLSVGKRGVQAEILSSRVLENESPLRITLLQGIARGEKMDLVLQKATELGVAAIVPVLAERTEVKLDAERMPKRIAHWRNIVISACEQCGRTRIPEVGAPAPLAEAVKMVANDTMRLTLDPFGTRTLAMLDAPVSASIAIAIGPEGGWSPRDREILHASGFEGLRLGPRVLRTETAGLAAIAGLQSRFGDF